MIYLCNSPTSHRGEDPSRDSTSSLSRIWPGNHEFSDHDIFEAVDLEHNIVKLRLQAPPVDKQRVGYFGGKEEIKTEAPLKCTSCARGNMAAEKTSQATAIGTDDDPTRGRPFHDAVRPIPSLENYIQL